jgi:hypothetical protein
MAFMASMERRVCRRPDGHTASLMPKNNRMIHDQIMTPALPDGFNELNMG